MPHPTPAARRFYVAFYRWAIISTPTRAEPCLAHQPSTPTSRVRGFHATTRYHEKEAPSFRIWKHISGPTDGESRPKNPSQASKRPGREPARAKLNHVPREFVHGVIQSAVAKPFTTFNPDEFAVRYRSDLSLMIEAAVPEDALQDFEHAREKHVRGARIEIQRDIVNTVGSQKLVSVLLSGTYHEVSRAWDFLHEYRPKVPVPPKSLSFTARPSHALLPLEAVRRRRRANGRAKIELNVLEQQWMRFIAAHDLQGIARETETAIVVEEPSMRPVDATSGRSEQARSFFISGREANVLRAHDAIHLAIEPLASATHDKNKPPEQKVEDEKAENQEAHPVDVASAVQRYFNILGPSQSKIVGIVMVGNGIKLLELKRKAGCKTLKQGLKNGTFMAEGTPAQLAKLHKILEKRVLRICNDHSLAVHEVKMLSKRPSKQSEQAVDCGKRTDEQLSSDVRTALRALTHPVVVVTSREPGKDDKLSERIRGARGVTVSSFNAVTLRPKPIVSFNLKVPSRSWDAMCVSNRLRVHLLADTPRSAAIASIFTQPYEQPYDGTRRLLQMLVGAKIPPGFAPPRLSSYGDVLSTFDAVLLLEHCVKVDDHMIVVAEVESCLNERKLDGTTFVDDTIGLSYLNRSYRSGGAPIKPLELPEVPPGDDLEKELSIAITARRAASGRVSLDPLALGDEPAPPRPHGVHRPLHNEAKAEAERKSDGDDLDAEPMDDPIYTALKAAGDAQKSSQQLQQSSSAHDEGREMSRKVEEEEEDYDLGFESYQEFAAAQPVDSPRDSSGPLWGPEDVAREESERLAENAAPRRPRNSLPTSTNSSSTRRYSTFARPALLAPLDSRRPFFPTITVRSDRRNQSTQVDPSARNMTVADFFGVPDEGRPHTPHVDSLVRAKQNAGRAERRLAKNPDLSDEEKLQLQHQIQIADRKIFKKLAWNAAIDLRVMLDKGRVDFRRAQFLESAIEKGQAVLLDEARQVRELLNQGKIDLGKFEAIKKRLAETSEVLMTEAMRLRQVADEEGDFFESAAGVEEEGEGFDGFRGNR